MRLVNFFSNRLKRYGVHISARAQVSPRAKFPHPTAIVIGDGVVIEDDVRIFQCVTVGAVRVGEGQAGRYPRIGRGTTVFAGAVIAGGIRIGENCTIGANSVVLTDIPDNSTCVGVPARIIAPHPQSEKVSG